MFCKKDYVEIEWVYAKKLLIKQYGSLAFCLDIILYCIPLEHLE